MKIYNNLIIKRKHQNSVIAIGNFDGLHLGHQKVINQAQLKAKKNKLPEIKFKINHNLSREFIYLQDVVYTISFFHKLLLRQKFKENFINIPGIKVIYIKDLIKKIRKISKYKGRVIIENIKIKGAVSKTLDGKLSYKYLPSIKKNFETN